MKRIIMTMFCVAVLLIGSTVSASAMVEVTPAAAFVKDSVTLSGTGVVNGNVYVGGAFSTTAITDSSRMNGDIYKGPAGTIDFKSADQYTGTTVNVEEADFPDTLPSFTADTSGIPNHATQNYTVGWWPIQPNLTQSWAFNKITVNNTLTIDTTAGDVILLTNSISGTGTIDIIGGNSVAIVVKNSISGDLRTTTNVTQDNLYLFVEKGDYTAPTYGNLAATVIMGTGTFNVGGSVTFDGVVISSGTGTFTATGATTVNAQYYTPNANVNLVSGTTFNGMIEANTLVVSGGSDLNYGSGYVYLPTSFFGEDAMDPSMIMPDEIVVSGDYVAGLKGTYFDAKLMTNDSAKRLEKQVSSTNFNYIFGSPDSVIEPETFSIEFTGYIKPTASGNYKFYTYSDDGVKLEIDGAAVIDRLEDISLEFTESSSVSLTGETYYPITLSYFENTINSILFLFYSKDGGDLSLVPSDWYFSDELTATQYFNTTSETGTGLAISYYNTKNGARSDGTPDATSTGDVDLVLLDGSPDPAINADNFSIRFEGYIEPRYTEELTMSFIVDDGIRVYIDDVLMLDEWTDHSGDNLTFTFNSVNGSKHKIRIEYYEGTLGANCQMFWYSDSIPPEIVPIRFLYETI